MVVLAIAVTCVLVLAVLYQAVVTVVFARVFWRGEVDPSPGGFAPKASIVLSLRGADPGLLENLQRLMQQDYPDYDLRIVVDRPEDPAWTIVQQATELTGAKNVHLSALRSRRTTCSLKCSALVQAIGELDQDCQIVALADADIQAPPDWLRQLVSPLRDERVGATFGNRWYIPPQGRGGSLVRYLWNAAAVVPMYLLSIPWAGTFAIRAAVLRHSGLLDLWSRSMVDDGPVRRALQAQGLRVQFVPALMMVNREECSWSFTQNFITRQLLWTRIYHPHWFVVLLHALASTGLLVLAVLLVLYGLLAPHWEIAAWAGTGLVVEQLAMLALLYLLDRCIGRVVEARGECRTQWSLVWSLRLFALLPVAQSMHLVAALRAHFQRLVVWRGVRYQIDGPWDIRLLEYRPFAPQPGPNDSPTSL
jgi:cellulose synthase/poly-beta-1,6-N-acetylglucosamine synthase-like glycosyltransferase